MNPLALIASVFPWDRQNESALGHRHLVLAYCLTWAIQLAYVAYVGQKWRSLRRARGGNPNQPS